MKKLFYDERINAEKGRAMRSTVWFSWLFTLIYTIITVIVDTITERNLVHMAAVDERFILSGILVEVITIIGGAVILLWGELSYIGADKDEMKAYEKNLFYTKGFYAFVYIFAFAYCVHVAVNLYYDGYTVFSNTEMPYGFFPSMLLQCSGMFLIFSLKNKNVMLHSAEIEDGGKPYFKKVFINILKFGGLCAVFVLFAVALFIIMSRAPFSKLCLVILFAGIGTWIALSFEYLMLSIMELMSEKAQKAGRLSITTLITFLLAAALSVLLFAIGVYANYFAEFNSSQTAILYSYTNAILARGLHIMTAFFVMYLCSELDYLKNDLIRRFGRSLNTIIIFKLCFDVLFMISSAIVSAKSFTFEQQLICRTVLLYAEIAINTLYLISILLCVIKLFGVFRDHKLLPVSASAFFTIYTAVNIISELLYVYLLRAPLNLIGPCLKSLLFVFFGIYLFKAFRKIKFAIE